MSLQLLINTQHREFYKHHTIAYSGDCGIDLFFPNDITIPAHSTLLVDLEITCEMRKTNTSFKSGGQEFFKSVSYFLFPRSSIYKTPLRMANSVGLIDSGYRNSIKVAIDNISDCSFEIHRGDKLFQICSSTLEEIKVVLTDDLSKTDRGSGFGSSNK